MSASAKPQSGPHVLVAEDNPVNQKVATAMLAKLGYRADIVANGVEAVEALSRIPYEAVLMDCQMPELDGYQATAEIREREGPSRHTPIIAMTAAAVEGDAERCFAAGMDDYISKPVELDKLDAVLRRWMGKDPPATSPADGSSRPPRAVLDHKRLAELRNLEIGPGRSAFPEWAAMFLEDIPPRLVCLREAVVRGNAPTVEQVAHYVMGASAHIGATGMVALCSELQTLGRSGDVGSAPEVVDRLEAEFERFRTTFHEELGTTELNARVLVIDDHELVRRALGYVLNAYAARLEPDR